MDSSFFLTIVAAAFGFFILFRKLRSRQEDNKENNASSLPPSSSLQPSSSLPPSSAPLSLYHVFLSFRGEDVRKNIFSHFRGELARNGITLFIDNEIKRGEFIGPELIRAIKGSRIAIILFSTNYASSSWCLDELVEIMKSREEIGQIVMPIFYKVDPSDVKKLTGDFGKVFKKTCAGKTQDVIKGWKQALGKVATIAGYHSSTWDDEATMIEKIVTEISNKLNNSAPSRDFDKVVGMRARFENKMKPLLCLTSDEVRMVGIWGPSGIGKTTIARFAYNQLSDSFQLSAFMDNIKNKYTRPCSDDYTPKLQLQQQLMSQITNNTDFKISHLGIVEDRLRDKKVLIVLDGVDKSEQLEAMAEKTLWFGPGSRIIITTQDFSLLRAHGINQIYKVGFPSTDEALQIFCMYAFGQKSPADGFEMLAWEVTRLAGELPLGLRVMGCHFKEMSKQEWKNELPMLRTSMNKEIGSILKFSYDALGVEDQELFLHVACFFNYEDIEKVEAHLGKRFLGVRQRLNALAKKSLVSIDQYGYITIQNLLVQLGEEIVRNQSRDDPGKRRFLVDYNEIRETLTHDEEGSKKVIGIKFNVDFIGDYKGLDVKEGAFKKMSNLRFLRFNGVLLQLPSGLGYLSPKLQLLHWEHFPMTSLPSCVNSESLIEIVLCSSELEKLWEGSKPLQNLKWMDLSYSRKLKELPDLSTAINLQELNLSGCSSLVELPYSIGNAINLQELNLRGCRNLVELPFSLGNATNLQELNLSYCSSLVELPTFIRNATNLQKLFINGCDMTLPSSIRNATNLQNLDLLESGKDSFRYWECDTFMAEKDYNEVAECSSPVKDYDGALRIFCMYAFGQKSPTDGFEELALEVTRLAGKRPLGLRVMGCHFKGMFKQEWYNELPRLRTLMNKEIWSILKFSYDALSKEDQDIFLHIACFFKNQEIEKVEAHLGKRFSGVRQGLNVLAEKFLISIDQYRYIEMHYLLVGLGEEIVRQKAGRKLGKRQFLVDRKEISEILTHGAAGSKKVIGIAFNFNGKHKGLLDVKEGAFKKMSNLRFIRFNGGGDSLKIPRGLDYLSPKLQLLHWNYFPMTSLPFCVNSESLIEVNLSLSKLEKLWEGSKTLQNLRWMDLSWSENLKELPDLSTAINLRDLNLYGCSNLEKLPSSIGNATNLQLLDLYGCTSLVEFPSSIGNLTNLQELNLGGCMMLEEIPSSIGNLTNLQNLDLSFCSSLEKVPSSIGNLTNLQTLLLAWCRKLEKLPSSIGNLQKLQKLDLRGCSNMKALPTSIINLESLEISRD